ncbi:MAG: hypothetical protein RIF41_00875 [Polyangiaceae bacterium]
MELGNRSCSVCADAVGFQSSWKQTEKFMPTSYDDEVDLLLARTVGFTTAGQVLAAARAELQQVLPTVIDLSWDPDVVIEEAVRAVRRYGDEHHHDIPAVLHEVAYWQRGERLVKTIPKKVTTAVDTKIKRALALKLLGRAFARIFEQHGKLYVHTRELAELQPDVVEAVGELLGRDTANMVALGILLGSFELKPGEDPPDWRSSDGKGMVTPGDLSGADRFRSSRKKKGSYSILQSFKPT